MRRVVPPCQLGGGHPSLSVITARSGLPCVVLLTLVFACGEQHESERATTGVAGHSSSTGGAEPQDSGGATSEGAASGTSTATPDAGGAPDIAATGGAASQAGAPADGGSGSGGDDCELIYEDGHGDLFVSFDEGLHLSIRSTFGTEPSEILADTSRVCVVVPAASYALAKSMGGAPESAEYAFLGVSAGEPFWLLPTTPRSGMPWFGASTEDVPSGRYVDNEVRVAIAAAEMPDGGQMAAWSTSTFGAPTAIFSTTTGMLVHSFPRGAHVHFNWSFSVAGRYLLTFRVAGQRDGGSDISPLSPLRFEVEG